MIDYSKYTWLDGQAVLPEIAQDNEQEVRRLLEFLDKKSFSACKKNIIARYYFYQCEQFAKENKLKQLKLDSNISRNLRIWEKEDSYKEFYKNVLEDAKGKYIMSGIVIIMTCTLLIFFLTAILTENFVINFSIDAIVGALAILFLVRNLKIKYKLLKKYTNPLNYLYFDVASIVLCIVLKIFMPASFDYSLVILFIAYYASKKKFDKALQELDI